MKLTALVIALAMLCMTMEGCDRYAGGGDTYSQKIDRALEKTNKTEFQVGNKVVSRIDQEIPSHRVVVVATAN